MNDIKLCGLILCALVICVIFKNIKNEYSLFVRLGITLVVSLASIGIMYPIFSYIDEIAKGTIIYSYIPTLIKALGITFAIQITSDACVDAGESSLSERISLFGRIEILLITLPLIKDLFSMTEELLK